MQLLEGKVVDVERHTAGGFVRGSVVVEGYGVDAGRLVRVEIQNENLVALEDGDVMASVPDLITLVDSQTADAVATEVVRYGQRVAVIAFPCARSGGPPPASRSPDREPSGTTWTTSRWRCAMASGLDLRLGIDVGGTHTDAVVLDRDNAVVAKTKQPTSSDVTTGVRARSPLWSPTRRSRPAGSAT